MQKISGMTHLATLPPGAGSVLKCVGTGGELPEGVAFLSESGRIFFLNGFGYLSEIRPSEKPLTP